ncbi:unnamed protein product [Ectocarpus sp. 12 AP-2014]
MALWYVCVRKRFGLRRPNFFFSINYFFVIIGSSCYGPMDAGTKLKVKFRTGDIGLRERRRRHRTGRRRRGRAKMLKRLRVRRPCSCSRGMSVVREGEGSVHD